MSSPSDGGWPPFPLPQGRPVPLKVACPHLIGRKINFDAYGGALKGVRPWHTADEPAPTLSKSGNSAVLENGRLRGFTVAEATAIASFPPDFRWLGQEQDAIARIGNSVPPRFMQAIAEVIRDEVLRVSEFTYLSTFAGCGGSSLGYKWAGGHGVAAVEFDHNAAETYRLNFPGVPVIERDIATVTAEELLTLTGLGIGQLDVLDGSPPCQGFSTAGKRQLDDPRNSLFREYVRLIDGLQPKVFVMENVSGMVKGKMRLAFKVIMGCLKATGYTVRCKLLNAMYFNVPQSRERLIWIGVRPDVGREPTFPKAQGRPVTVREAIGHLPVGEPERHAAHMRQQWETWAHHIGSYYSIRLDPDKPAPTITRAPLMWRYDCFRRITLEEAALLGSFPAGYRWHGKPVDVHQRIGNCVPPRFMQAIAEHIRDHILCPLAAGSE